MFQNNIWTHVELAKELNIKVLEHNLRSKCKNIILPLKSSKNVLENYKQICRIHLF